MYICYKITEDWCQPLGVYSSFDKAKARIRRYMNSYGMNKDINKYVLQKLTKDVWVQETTANFIKFQISRIKIDEDLG